MKNNRAAVLLAAGQIEVRKWPFPDPSPGDAVVEVKAVGICGSDVHYFSHGRIADNVVTSPVVLGHEPAGRVLSAPAGYPFLAEGTRVAIEPQRSCGNCRWCRSGAYNMCPDMRFMADPPVHGALARYVSVPAAFCHPLPDSISDEEGALVEPLAVALWAGMRARIAPGDAVLVSGAGPIGILALQVALALGAARVVVSDISSDRLAFAATFGAEAFLIDGAGYAGIDDIDVVLECSGAPGSVRAASLTLNPRGRLAAVGIGRSALAEIDLLRVQSHELEIIGVYRYAGIYARAISLLARGAVQVRPLITHRFSLDETAEAFLQAATNPSVIKAVIFPS